MRQRQLRDHSYTKGVVRNPDAISPQERITRSVAMLKWTRDLLARQVTEQVERNERAITKANKTLDGKEQTD